MDLLDRAILFAVKAHEGQTRKDGGPYILHPLETAAIAASITGDREVLSAAVLHDTVEDTAATAQDIEHEFGARVAKLVASETEDKRRDLPPDETWQIRKEESLTELQNTGDSGVKILWLSDKLSNLRAFSRAYRVCGDAFWQKFHQQDPEKQHWYYRSVASATAELSDTPAWEEYDKLVRSIFNETR